jgi:hypothetical protein
VRVNLSFHILSILLLVANLSFGQGFNMQSSSSIADCFGAVEITDYSKESSIQFPGNFGERDDFMNIDPDFHEVNSVWLRLEPNVEGQFEFEIITEDNVDFSFYLFKAADNSFCSQLDEKELAPIRAEESSFRKKGVSKSLNGSDDILETEKNDIYYLMIHTNSTYQGHVLVNYKRIGKVDEVDAEVQDFRLKKDENVFRVKIRDRETGAPVIANITITGIKRNNYLFLGTDFLFDTPVSRRLTIESNTQGYFLFSKTIEIDNSGDSDVEYIVYLERLAVGKKLALEDIHFRQDSEEFLPISLPVLKRLIDFMAVNHSIRIQIEGHVNAPGYKNTMKIKSLSEKRAEAVRDFLVENGINESRIEVVGYGNTQMLYEKPKNSNEESANRRTEIVIID